MDKDKVIDRLEAEVLELETQLKDAHEMNADLQGRLRGGATREAFAKKCFDVGYGAAIKLPDTSSAEVNDDIKRKNWLQFKAEEL